MTDLSARAFIFDMDGTLVDKMHVDTEACALCSTNTAIFRMSE
ncbi:MAG: hypothetical protein ABL999_10150 [Pyrinomonadaceae bacterium]